MLKANTTNFNKRIFRLLIKEGKKSQLDQII